MPLPYSTNSIITKDTQARLWISPKLDTKKKVVWEPETQGWSNMVLTHENSGYGQANVCIADYHMTS